MQNQTTIKSGYKSSPLGPIPSDWEIQKLGGRCSIKTGKKDVNEGNPIGVYPFFTCSRNHTYSDSYSFDTEAILIAGNGEVGNLNYFNGKFEAYQRTYVLDKFTDSLEYIYQYLGAFLVDSLQQESIGTSIPYIKLSSLEKFPIRLPTLVEQTAIANLLSTWDEAISKVSKLIEQYENRKKGLIQKLLSGKVRPKGHTQKWQYVELKQLFNEVTKINDGGDGHTIMTISAKSGLISQDDKFDRVIAGDSLKKYTQLENGDFAYNKGNSKTYEMGCIYQLKDCVSALVPFVYICFRPKDIVDDSFYRHWFLAHGLDRQLKGIISSGARGDGLLNVSTTDFFNLKVPFLPIDEQKEIGFILNDSDIEINLLKSKLKNLKEQKKGLMQQLLTGKKRLKF